MTRAPLISITRPSSTGTAALVLLAGLGAYACGGGDTRSDAEKAYDSCVEMANGDESAAVQCQQIKAAADDQQGGIVGADDGTPGGSNGSSGSSPGDFVACATGGASASLKPVSMLLIVDRSSSMNNNNKWTQASDALVSFLQSEQTSGLSIALRFYPDDNGGDLCNSDGCNESACAQPLVGSGMLTAEPAPADAQEQQLVDAIESTSAWAQGGRGTPTYPALAGGLDWARDYQANHPKEQAVVILVTDGEPHGCNDDNTAIAGLAGDAYQNDGILTYAIGLEGSREAQMDEIAQAGGTGDGIFIGSANAQSDLLDALNNIRGEALDCEFAVPTPADGELDPNKVNVVLTSNGEDTQFDKVDGEGQCGDAASWYYQGSDRIVLCPAACNKTLSDPNAEVGLVFGCTTGDSVIGGTAR